MCTNQRLISGHLCNDHISTTCCAVDIIEAPNTSCGPGWCSPRAEDASPSNDIIQLIVNIMKSLANGLERDMTSTPRCSFLPDFHASYNILPFVARSKAAYCSCPHTIEMNLLRGACPGKRTGLWASLLDGSQARNVSTCACDARSTAVIGTQVRYVSRSDLPAELPPDSVDLMERVKSLSGKHIARFMEYIA